MKKIPESQSGIEAEQADTLLIRNTTVDTVKRRIDQTKLRFYPDNPRVFSFIRADNKEPSQEEIQEHLLELDHVKGLIQSIKLNGGLIDPIIVLDGRLEVLEGNSRLAAYRALAKNDPIRWAKMPCIVLPEDIDESLIFALLGEYHIKGKKDWVPYEQAGFLYRRFKNHKIDLKTLAVEIGLTQNTAKHLIETYQFMLDHDQTNTARWSYYDEYLKSPKIRKAREQFTNLDELIIEKINGGEIEKAVDVRDRLPVICSAPGKTLKNFVLGDYDFEEAFEHAIATGGNNATYKKLEKFRRWLGRNEIQEGILEAKGQIQSKLIFEIDKLSTLANLLRTKLHKKN